MTLRLSEADTDTVTLSCTVAPPAGVSERDRRRHFVGHLADGLVQIQPASAHAGEPHPVGGPADGVSAAC